MQVANGSTWWKTGSFPNLRVTVTRKRRFGIVLRQVSACTLNPGTLLMPCRPVKKAFGCELLSVGVLQQVFGVASLENLGMCSIRMSVPGPIVN